MKAAQRSSVLEKAYSQHELHYDNNNRLALDDITKLVVQLKTLLKPAYPCDQSCCAESRWNYTVFCWNHDALAHVLLEHVLSKERNRTVQHVQTRI